MINDIISSRRRTQILRLLSDRPMTVTELAVELNIDPTQAKTNLRRKHLDVLEQVGLVVSDTPRSERRPRGQAKKVLYWTNPAAVDIVKDAWGAYAKGQEPALPPAMQAALEALGSAEPPA